MQTFQGLDTAPDGPTFGVHQEGTDYTERRAAYAIVFDGNAAVAGVRGPSGHYWLPGDGSLPGESAENTITREIREELARGVRLIERIGDATQFFFATNDHQHYKMLAVFYRAEFTEVLSSKAEHELCWIPCQQARAAFFHECHGWAVDQAASGHAHQRTH